MKVKKFVAVVIIVILMLTVVQYAFAKEEDPVTVYISVSVDGKLKLAAAPVRVTKSTLDAALKAAHSKYYPDGEIGYEATPVGSPYQYFEIKKMWGSESQFLLVVNDQLKIQSTISCFDFKHPIKEGDNIVISLVTAPDEAPKAVTCKTIITNSIVIITARIWTQNMALFYQSKPFADAAIIDPLTGTVLGKTDRYGEATINIPDSGEIAIEGLSAFHARSPVLPESATTSSPIEPDSPPPPAPADYKAVLSNQAVRVNGTEVAFEVYNINGSNYFKLRDLAYVLKGTRSQFSVDYDPSKQAISCFKGVAYTPDGSELAIGSDKASTAVPSAQSLYIDGNVASLSAFNIGNNNFFKLRDLGTALEFNVEYDDATRTLLITSM